MIQIIVIILVFNYNIDSRQEFDKEQFGLYSSLNGFIIRNVTGILLQNNLSCKDTNKNQNSKNIENIDGDAPVYLDFNFNQMSYVEAFTVFILFYSFYFTFINDVFYSIGLFFSFQMVSVIHNINLFDMSLLN